MLCILGMQVTFVGYANGGEWNGGSMEYGEQIGEGVECNLCSQWGRLVLLDCL